MAIVKILSRHSPSYASLVKYVLRYVANEDKSHGWQVYTQNLRSGTITGYVKEFVENEAFRRQSRTDQIHLFHEIVSFGAMENREAITPAMIDDLAQQYMRLRGNAGVMVGAVHRDKDHVHMHFCVSALHYRTGKSFGLGKAQLHELKTSFQKYHELHYPELTKSVPFHGRGGRYMSDRAWRVQQRQQIVERVRQCFAQAKSQTDFLSQLRAADLHHYERNGVPTGITYEGVKFRFSRLLEERQLSNLPIDRSEEEQVLAEISAIRERQRGRDERSHDIGDRER